MKVRFTSWLLAVGLFLSSSALTPEECQPLVAPLSLIDPSKMYGRSNFISGYSDQEIYKFMMKITESSWLNMSASKPSGLVMSQENRMNGTCFKSTTNVTVDGNTATTSYANVTSAVHVLPSCDGCLVFSINSTAQNIGKLLALLQLTSSEEVITARALYLLARGSTVTDADMERFKQQAKCLGFAGEPDFLYNPDKEFCREGESIQMPLS